MSLRNTPHKRNRDCDLTSWHEVYTHLVNSGLRVVVIPDSDDVLGDRKYADFAWNVFPEAGIDLELRLATYSISRANVAWASGHNTLLFYSDLNCIVFGYLDESEPTSSSDFFRRKGPYVNQQPAWFLPGKQLIDWIDRQSVTTKFMIERVSSYIASL